jgi:wyosine [tRNA(Phe)-imidazoG37] synthetase (radical SAM superfamily)
MTRQPYVPTLEVIDELRDWAQDGGQADFITLSGSGEPTLHSCFGDVIDAAQILTPFPVALLTNGSMLGDPDVQEAALQADVVKVSLSAWDQQSFEQINRPHPDIMLEDVIEDVSALRQMYSGELWVEVFIVWGVNSTPADVARIAEKVCLIEPDRIQLNTAVRPPAERFVRPASQKQLEALADLFAQPAEVIAEFSSMQTPQLQANEATILAMIARRPCTARQIGEAFGMHQNEVSKYIGKLMRTGRIRAQDKAGDVYYLTQNAPGRSAAAEHAPSMKEAVR